MRRSIPLLFTVLSLGTSGCNPPPPPVYSDPVTVSKLARIPIPSSATNVTCRTDRDDTGFLPAPDHAYWGRFDIPATDLPFVLAGMPKDEKVKTNDGYSNVTSHKMTEAWWHPEQLRNPQLAEWSVPGFSFNLMFGENGTGGMLTVYFFNFEL